MPIGLPPSRGYASFRSIRRPATLAGILALALAGCAVGPDYAGFPQQVPDRWSATSDTRSRPAPDGWWRRLGDAKLNRIVEDAVGGNLDVATAKARVREARALRAQSTASLFPVADGAASADRSQARDIVSNSTRLGIDASWEVDIFGGNARGVEAASRGVESAAEDLKATLVTLAGDVATSYIEARGFQARAALARRTVVSLRETARLTRVSQQAGSTPPVDVARIDAQVATTTANVPALELAYARAVHRLAVLTGREPAALKTTMGSGGPIPAARRRLPTGVPADVLRNRPDVRRAERELARSTALVGQATAELYPKLSLTGSLSTSGSSAASLSRSTAIGWSYGPTLTLPILDAGRRVAAVEVSQAQRDQSFLAFRATVLTALEDVENAATALSRDAERQRSLSIAVTQLREAARLTRTTYTTGATSFLDALDAERSLYSAEDALLQARVDLANDYVAMSKALGGGWDRPVDTSVPAVRDANVGPRLRDLGVTP